MPIVCLFSVEVKAECRIMGFEIRRQNSLDVFQRFCGSIIIDDLSVHKDK